MEKIGKYITNYIKGKTPKVLFDSELPDALPYLSPDYLRGVSDPELYAKQDAKTIVIDDGEVIVLWDGSNAGEILISKKGILASTMTMLQFDETEINKAYFGYSFQNLEYILKAKTAGSGIPHADKGVINKLEFYKPSPHEQTAIAHILSKVDEAIASVQGSIAAAERLKKSLMQNLLTGRMKPDGTLRKENEFYMDEKFGKVPMGWEVKRIDEIADFVQYGLNQASSETGNIPMFRMNNIVNGEMQNYPLVYVNLNGTALCQYKLEKGDILFNRTNSMDLVGKVGVFKLEGDYVFASYLIRIRVSKENNPYFVNYALNSYPIQCSLRSKATPAVSQANINSKSLRVTSIMIPTEKQEQDAIVSKIERIELEISNKEQNIATLERLKKSLMQNLLTGKIRIKNSNN
jgi:type I restriction enzyme S subunit